MTTGGLEKSKRRWQQLPQYGLEIQHVSSRWYVFIYYIYIINSCLFYLRSYKRRLGITSIRDAMSLKPSGIFIINIYIYINYANEFFFFNVLYLTYEWRMGGKVDGGSRRAPGVLFSEMTDEGQRGLGTNTS
jgi:hypothetical protein